MSTKTTTPYYVIGDGPKTIEFFPDRQQLIKTTLKELGLSDVVPSTFPVVTSVTDGAVDRLDPTTGKPLAKVPVASWPQIDTAIKLTVEAQSRWKELTGNQRVEILTAVGEALKSKMGPLSKMLSIEIGKIPTEGEGEITEVLDVLKLIQERAAEVGGNKKFRVIEYPSGEEERRQLGWVRHLSLKPLGLVLKNPAFNFPAAVFGWGALPALAAGNGVFLKPHEDASLTSLAMIKIISNALNPFGFGHLVSVAVTDRENGRRMWEDPRFKLVEATGSEQMGREVAKVVAPSFRRSTLELGGNNAVIIDKGTDINQAVEILLFNCAGTAGQRCTTARRIFIHKDVYDEFCEKFIRAYKTLLHIGDPLQPGVNVGPVFHHRTVKLYTEALEHFTKSGSKLLVGGRHITGNFVEPTVMEAPSLNFEASYEERFVPIVNLFRYSDADWASGKVIAEVNNPGYGLAGGVFTKSDSMWDQCVSEIRVGILNRNYGSSGAEAVGYFGGEGRTGNGRMLGTKPDNGAMFSHYVYPTESVIAKPGKIVHAQGVNFSSSKD